MRRRPAGLPLRRTAGLVSPSLPSPGAGPGLSGQPTALLAAQGAAFVCVVAAPDTVILVGLQREGEAMGPDRADGADGLGLPDLGDGPPVFPIGKKSSGS
jgi:hypothetical protein